MAKRGQNEGSIYQREDGRWVGSLNLGYINGKRRRKDFYGITRKSVQEKLTSALNSQQTGIPIPIDQQSVTAYLQNWLTDVVKRERRPKTFESYEGLVRLHIAPVLGKYKLEKLTTHHVRSLLNSKQDSGLSSRTCQYMHAVLRKALNDAVAEGLLARNVVALVKPPHVEAKEVQPLTPTQARKFLQFIGGDRLEAFYTVALSLGLRQGEAIALRSEDVDLEKGTLQVRYTLHRRKREIYLAEPKNKDARRPLALPNVTLTALADHVIRHREERETCGSRWKTPMVNREGKQEPVDFLFTTTVGTPLDGRAVTKRFQRVLKLAGIKRHRFHDLRHTAATLLAVQGVHKKAIQEALGWSQMSMVDRYTHVVDEMKKDTAAKMDEILRGPGPVAVTVAVNSKAN